MSSSFWRIWAIALAIGTCSASGPAAERPNVILFLVDDMGWMDSTPYGSRYYETPQMERFARTAMRFTEAYACPLCSPTRATILSGQYSARHGVTSATGHQPPQPEDAVLLAESGPASRPVIYPESRNYLRPSQITLAESLKAAGYRTGHFGKWHLGLTEPYWPDKQGFDVAFHGKPDPGPGSYFSPYSFKQYQSFQDGPPGEYITDRVTSEAIRFIESSGDQPFYLNLWHYGVHGPWGHKDEYTKEFAKKSDPRNEQGNPIMASMLRSIDESLGRVLDRLDELGIADQTIVIFYSDNGGNVHSNTPDDRNLSKIGPNHPKYAQLMDWRKWAGERPPTNNAPLRDGKGRLYEGGIRVPLMVRWPGVVQPESTSHAVVGPIDLYPTILDMVAADKPSGQIFDGVTLVPVLKQTGSLPRDAYFTWFPHNQSGVVVRQGDWKLIRRFEPTDESPTGRELFNLRNDLSETHNLAEQMPDKVQELDALIDRFIAETGALAPKPNPAYVPGRSPRGGNPAASEPLLGWVPRFCTSRAVGNELIVEADGRDPFLAMVRVKTPGPLELRGRLHSGHGGQARAQWRTESQDAFPADGQTVRFAVPTKSGEETRVALPIDGTLAHLRLHLPANDGPVAVDWLELWQTGPTEKRLKRWDFGASPKAQ
ncbi:MAG: sulfatase [Planctomycetaceae bacterium]